METQIKQLIYNVKGFAKKAGIAAVGCAFALAIMITADSEVAKNGNGFGPMSFDNLAANAEHPYAFGSVALVDYDEFQNQNLVASRFLAAGESDLDISSVELEAKETETVASAQSTVAVASPMYADPAMNGYEFLGTYVTTGYCPCARCCGKTNGITASGTHATANHTIAADTSVLPFGTQVVINGQVYTVEDRGGAIHGNRIDIFFATHQDALNYGRRRVDVYRYVGTSENASTVAVETISETPDIASTTENTGASATTETLLIVDASATTTEATEAATETTTTEAEATTSTEAPEDDSDVAK